MPNLGHPGRWLFPDSHPAAHRLAVYNESNGTLIGCVPIQYPVNDVAFSSNGENVLIATGKYDGGHFFVGYLLRFNFITGETEQLLGQCREVLSCRYDGDEFISALLRPADEEEFEGDAWSIAIAIRIPSGPGPWSGEKVETPREDKRLIGLTPSLPCAAGFPDFVFDRSLERSAELRKRALGWLSSMQAESYSGICDLRWIDEGHFAFVARGVSIETRTVTGERLKRVPCEGCGVELVDHPHLGLLSHVQLTENHGGRIDTRSELWLWDENVEPTKLAFNKPYSFSFDCTGLGLAIDVSGANRKERRNLFLARDGQVVQSVDCGVSDRLAPTSFPHNLDALYFLKREGEETFRNNDYRLWRHDGSGEFACLRPWDNAEHDFCPVVSRAYTPTSILGAGPTWNRISHHKIGLFLELIDVKNGHRSASIEIPSSPTCIAVTDDQGTAVVGSVDGGVRCLDLSSGITIGEIFLSNRSAVSVPLSLAVKRNQILVGTNDGRILSMHLDKG
jgi:hypothetical protein